MSLACADLAVLDLSRSMAGALATMILAEHGADVIRVEQPGGAGWAETAGFPTWNRRKRCAQLDLKRAEDRARFRELAATADVVVEDFRPGVLDRLGLGYSALS